MSFLLWLSHGCRATPLSATRRTPPRPYQSLLKAVEDEVESEQELLVMAEAMVGDVVQHFRG